MGTRKIREEYPYRKEYIRHHSHCFNSDVYRCSICFKKLTEKEMVVDHIVPLAKFGVNHIWNCVSCCKECNTNKGDSFDSRTYKQIVYKIYEELAIGACMLLTFIFKCLKDILDFCMGSLKKTEVKKPEVSFLKHLSLYKVICLIIILFILYKFLGRGNS